MVLIPGIFVASNDDGLSGYWPFDQGLIDKSGNGNRWKDNSSLQ